MSTAAVNIEELKYPVGKFQFSGSMSDAERAQHVETIAQCPAKMRAAVAGLTEQQLNTPYRPGGWTVRQVVHHVPDSHMNAYVRFKLALTEDEPTIKPYKEDKWAELVDTRETPIETSLVLLEKLHERWVRILRSLSSADLQRKMRHPELGVVTLERYVAMYAWHSQHHVAHITALRARMGWGGA